METNTLPTADTFILHKIIINESFNYSDIVLWTKEYAILFAKWHREKQEEAIQEKVNKEVSDMGLAGSERYIISDSIENAYPESEIQ